jgi:DNA-binding transcriptional MerR regulator
MIDPNDESHFPLEEVAEMLSITVETIESYESQGLVRSRDGETKVFSSRDVLRIRRVTTAVELGVNIEGADVVCNLLERLDDLTHELEVRKEQLRRLCEE